MSQIPGSFAIRGGFGSDIQRKLLNRGMSISDVRALLNKESQ
jgi:hypothetical protein